MHGIWTWRSVCWKQTQSKLEKQFRNERTNQMSGIRLCLTSVTIVVILTFRHCSRNFVMNILVGISRLVVFVVLLGIIIHEGPHFGSFTSRLLLCRRSFYETEWKKFLSWTLQKRPFDNFVLLKKKTTSIKLTCKSFVESNGGSADTSLVSVAKHNFFLSSATYFRGDTRTYIFIGLHALLNYVQGKNKEVSK